MKDTVHARLGDEDRKILRDLKKTTGETESSLVKRGLRLVYQKEVKSFRSALDLAGEAVGKFSSGIGDLSHHKKHLEDYGR